ncbi:hypothetical protein GOBAR_AA37846 [Gossypium barbadense]|uniref:Uncharacterized protein n=1 Tax=Gossypium barbadense TaxID=3634 RepID=A0A2P5VVK4_GOSBA|nr:hypothetical protein GOBAR_AA37846 [Gossypium barbadense]
MKTTGELEGEERRRLEELVENNPDDSSLHFQLRKCTCDFALQGVCLWETQTEKEKAAEHWVISVKQNPKNAAAFIYLGHYYATVSVDIPRAIKCYQRALSLNPDDSDSGEALCDFLDSQGKETLEVAICKDASHNSPRAFWAFRRLGCLQVHQKKWSEAVQSLQQAIRGYPTSPDLWEALGLAYHRLGMFTAAIKSYSRAIELEDSRVFALIECGNIFLMLGSFRKNLPSLFKQHPCDSLELKLISMGSYEVVVMKGIEQFQQALKISPQNMSALYGLASGLLGMAKECRNSGAFRWAASLLEDACKVAEASIKSAGNSSCTWKLHGDVLGYSSPGQLTYAQVFPWTEESQSLEYNAETFKKSVYTWKNTCRLAAKSARNSYQRALHLAPWQANIYIDIAISSNLISSFNQDYTLDKCTWKLPEKLTLGALALEGENSEFWVALSCLTECNALKQHSLIRGLQLDVSLAYAWAYLGKELENCAILSSNATLRLTFELYREENEKKLARQAFDCARGIDPSLALPWAGMSADAHTGDSTPDDAFESCLRAVEIFPVSVDIMFYALPKLAEFQIGLAKLALLSGNLSSSQVFGAIQQAVQRAPHYHESHNLNGLVHEARMQFQTAIASYRLARYAINISLGTVLKSHLKDISTNLARSLSKAGNAIGAVQECEDLKKEGEGVGLMQQWFFSIKHRTKHYLGFQNGVNHLRKALHMYPNSILIRNLLGYLLLCSEVWGNSHVSSRCSVVDDSDSKNKEGLKSAWEISSAGAVACHAIGNSEPRFSFPTCSCQCTSSGAMQELQMLDAEGLQIYAFSLWQLGENDLALSVTRALAASVSTMDRISAAVSVSFICRLLYYISGPDLAIGSILKMPKELFHSSKISFIVSAINALDQNNRLESIISSSRYFLASQEEITGMHYLIALSKLCLRQEPWNHNARYLLILNLLQKAREERFPVNICIVLERLISVALSNEFYSGKEAICQYQKFQIYLCASEILLQRGNIMGCIDQAKNASALSLPDSFQFFGHLLLCRAYAAEGNLKFSKEEYERCLELKTDFLVGWLCLKLMESQYEEQPVSNIFELAFKEGSEGRNNSWNMWMAVYSLVMGLICLWNRDFLSAEEFLEQPCSLTSAESCIFLCHGVTSMEIARRYHDSQFLSSAIRSLSKAHITSSVPIPIVSALLAQAEGSIGSRKKWERNLRLEWFSWPPGIIKEQALPSIAILTPPPLTG